MSGVRFSLKKIILAPLTDTLYGLEGCLSQGWKSLLGIFLGLLVGWWVYVPLHELLHAAACLVAGGSVSRLEIDPLYFGGVLEQLIPWVESGSEYAGRLSGFATGGSDLVYLLTDFGPFLLTILPGVWWLRRAARRGHAPLFGAALPFALAPFLSLTGDAYEIGSILVSRIPPWSRTAEGLSLRGDDLFKKAGELGDLAIAAPWAGLILGSLLGLVWALATYLLASRVARALGEPLLADPRGKI